MGNYSSYARIDEVENECERSELLHIETIGLPVLHNNEDHWHQFFSMEDEFFSLYFFRWLR